jgi:DNA primase
MAGLISRNDIDEVRSRTNIADVVGDYVTLKRASAGSMKGLCPFHDERSPSFHVRPQVGFYHCFGCGEGGDVFKFLQQIDHVSFSEAVERLAAKIGFELHYEDGGQASDHSSRARLLAANDAARDFFIEQLVTPEADIGRRFLGERGFDPSAAERFGVGFAPKGWDILGKHLRGRGFTNDELSAAGLTSTGERGSYDRFRGRLIWPIRDQTGQTVGFGARKLLDDDQGPKYLNTPETLVYHKAQVLYGLDLAKRDIARSHQVVVVEGYTDVMACHLAGVTTAVATCGTSFGVDHIKIMRRVLSDDSAGLGEVVFTFDPDAAGQKAALRAFSEEQRFAAQTYVAVAPDGLDPCDLRLNRGDEAVRRLVAGKKPMFEFVIKQRLSTFDLNTVEGRVAALRAAAPVVADIRDPSIRPGYARELARLLGMDIPEVMRAVDAGKSDASKSDAGKRNDEGHGSSRDELGSSRELSRRGESDQRLVPASDGGAASITSLEIIAPVTISLTQLPSTTAVRLERDALMAMLQFPTTVGSELLARASLVGFSSGALALVRDAIATNLDSHERHDWVMVIQEAVPEAVKVLVTELAVAPVPERPERNLELYLREVTISLIERDLVRRKEELLGQLQRTDSVADAEASRSIQQQLVRVEAERRALRG